MTGRMKACREVEGSSEITLDTPLSTLQLLKQSHSERVVKKWSVREEENEESLMSTTAIKYLIWIISLGDGSKKKFTHDEHFVTSTHLLMLQLIGLLKPDYTHIRYIYVYT